ncbi:hypothetical protein HPB47_012289 [Ixodes persulcatus]|uniref:Uncharacterized protein n=1 Tax=Ixodes persulcatus TaxID=34615 RepID=A0AC60NU34_IXOPE|nr:hypothetical protein HPB47_012289 [Ixodes persulcatus]
MNTPHKKQFDVEDSESDLGSIAYKSEATGPPPPVHPTQQAPQVDWAMFIAKGFVDGAKATGSSCSSPREPFFENVGALVVSAVLLAFALLVAVGTAYDLCYSYQGGRKKPSSFQSVETKVASSEGLVDDEDQKDVGEREGGELHVRSSSADYNADAAGHRPEQEMLRI